MGRFSLAVWLFIRSVLVDVVNVEPIRVRANEVRHFGLADEVDWRLHPGDLPRSIVRVVVAPMSRHCAIATAAFAPAIAISSGAGHRLPN